MKTAPKHPKEKQRLESLRALNILDTLPDKDFDAITTIASQICDSPIALISLVDGERQWFKSKIGITGCETPRDLSFCAHAILQPDVLVVNNTLNDDRFSDNPMVVGDPQIRFYAGAPLLSPDGYPIGTLCVVDTKAKVLLPSQIAALEALSTQVTHLLEMKIQLKIIKEANASLTLKKTAMDNISDGIILLNSDGEVIESNPAAIGFFEEINIGSQRRLKEMNLRKIHEDGSEFHTYSKPSLVALRTGKSQLNKVIGIYTEGNNLKWFSFSAVPLFLNGSSKPSHVVTSFSDISEMKAMEEQRRLLELKLSESARLSALGEMAGGVAHEINNPLAIIYGRAYLLKKKFSDGTLDLKKNLKDFEIIERTVDRIAKIVRGLKNYSRNAENDPYEAALLSHILDDTFEICGERFRSHEINIDIQCNPNLEIQCRPAQISQIIMNLMLNSFDAIESLPEKWIRIQVIEQGDSLKILCSDSGHGIPESVARKIMQPFYTTKEVGKGTGLGLSISTSIAEAHGGKLNYDPSIKNTTFLLELPKIQPITKVKAAS